MSIAQANHDYLFACLEIERLKRALRFACEKLADEGGTAEEAMEYYLKKADEEIEA